MCVEFVGGDRRLNNPQLHSVRLSSDEAVLGKCGAAHGSEQSNSHVYPELASREPQLSVPGLAQRHPHERTRRLSAPQFLVIKLCQCIHGEDWRSSLTTFRFSKPRTLRLETTGAWMWSMLRSWWSSTPTQTSGHIVVPECIYICCGLIVVHYLWSTGKTFH
jgi:hypothetical protein